MLNESLVTQGCVLSCDFQVSYLPISELSIQKLEKF